MSLTHPMTSSSSNFQLIINNALDTYKKRTKDDLLAHPLVTELQYCNSPSTTPSVLHAKQQTPSERLDCKKKIVYLAIEMRPYGPAPPTRPRPLGAG